MIYVTVCFQIHHMMAFIDQEANEKAEEIDAKVSGTRHKKIDISGLISAKETELQCVSNEVI